MLRDRHPSKKRRRLRPVLSRSIVRNPSGFCLHRKDVALWMSIHRIIVIVSIYDPERSLIELSPKLRSVQLLVSMR